MGFLSSLFKKDKAQEADKEVTPQVPKDQEENNFDLFKYDGVRAGRIGKTAYAILCFQKALEIKEDYEVLGLLAQTYAQTGQLEEAVVPLERMSQLHPEIEDTALSLSNLYYMLEDYENMVSWAKKAIEINPESALAHLHLGKAFYATQDIKSAAASLDQALMIEPSMTEAKLLRAQIHSMEKEYDQAIGLLDAILESGDDDEGALLIKAGILETTGRKDQAEEIYRGLIQDNPFQMASYVSLSLLLLDDGKQEEAEKILSDALEMKPDYVDARKARLAIRRARGDESGVLEDEQALQEALEEEPEIPDFVIKGQKETDVLGL